MNAEELDIKKSNRSIFHAAFVAERFVAVVVGNFFRLRARMAGMQKKRIDSFNGEDKTFIM